MSKQRKYLAAGATISGILVLGTTVVTLSSVGKAKKVHEGMQRSLVSLQSYFERDPFPNSENVEAEQAKLETLRDWNQTLYDALSTSNIVVTGEHTPGSFSKECEDTIKALRKAAPQRAKDEFSVGIGGAKAEDSSFVTANFNFGFDRYDLTQNGLLAVSDDVPHLLRQLKMIDRLVRVFYETEVIKLERVLREEFEIASGGGEARTARGRGGRRSSAGETGVTGVSLDRIDVEPITDAPFDIARERFGFVFTTKEAGLIELIDKFNAMSPFAQISSLDFQKTTGDVKFTDTKAATGADTGIAQPASDKASRIVSAPDREAPIRVAMTIDIYTLGTRDEAQDSD